MGSNPTLSAIGEEEFWNPQPSAASDFLINLRNYQAGVSRNAISGPVPKPGISAAYGVERQTDRSYAGIRSYCGFAGYGGVRRTAIPPNGDVPPVRVRMGVVPSAFRRAPATRARVGTTRAAGRPIR